MMPTVRVPETPLIPFSKKPGSEPIPGYVLIEPLGRGGFGEVWKCEAPGGLHKAIKFVAGADDELADGNGAQLRQEYEAFQQIKVIRHPYLLCIERVELIDNELIMVMGLADCQLGDRLHACQRAGLAGIPRDELLGYLREAAEALDFIGAQYDLQHLDVKPANLFLTAGHVQVGDYGLVSKLDSRTGTGKNRGLTPRYAAPEVLCGRVHTRSDQYSLALVYHELLTGTFPYSGRTLHQIILQHSSGVPDLTGLPERDRGPVGKALSKQPGDRFPSCRDFIDALMNVKAVSVPTAQGLLVTPAPKSQGPSSVVPRRPLLTPVPRSPAPAAAAPGSGSADETAQRPALTATSPALGAPPAAPPPAHPAPRTGAQLRQILSVLPVEWLRGQEAPDPDLSPSDMVRAVVAAATAPGSAPSNPVGVVENPDGTWTYRFLTTIDPRVAKVKLDLLWEQGGVVMDARAENRVVFRQTVPVPAPTGLFGNFGKKPAPPPAGFEVVVQLPEPGTAVGEVLAHGRLFGAPPPEFTRRAGQSIVALLEGTRRELNNFQDRRKHPRLPADFPIILYPIQNDGRVETPINGFCRDVSAGGLALRTTSQPPTRYAYVAFQGVRGITGLALLVQIVRTNREDDGTLVSGRYRLDLAPRPAE